MLAEQMHKQKTTAICVLLFLCCSSSVQAGFLADNNSTNNITNWDGYVNAIAGGRWSYLQGDPTTGVSLLPDQYYAPDDWCADSANPNIVWMVYYDGAVKTDGYDISYNYTVDNNESGWIRIHGTQTGNGNSRLRIFATTDNQTGAVDATGAFVLYDSTGPSHTFDIITQVGVGNDIIFASDNFDYWWEVQILDATITQTTEPVTTITVLQPDGNVACFAGKAFPVTWQTSGAYIEKVALEYSLDNGATWIPIDVVANDGSYDWVAPEATSDQVLLKISSAVPDLNVQDSSDAVFTVFPVDDFGDHNADYFIDMLDFLVLAEEWMQCGDPLGCN